MNNDFYNKLIEFVLSDAEEYSNKKITPNQAIKSLTDWYNSSIRSTIIHELQHAVDAYKSNEQNVLTPQAREYSLNRKDADYEPFNAEVEKKLFKDYLNLPHEIWGRFAEAASNTWMILNGKQIDVHNYIDKFKLSYDNFDDLSKKNQQIILKAAYKYYDLKKDEFVK